MGFRAEMKDSVYTLTADVAMWRVDRRSDGVFIIEVVGGAARRHGPMTTDDVRSFIANRQEMVLAALEEMEVKTP